MNYKQIYLYTLVEYIKKYWILIERLPYTDILHDSNAIVRSHKNLVLIFLRKEIVILK